MLFLLAASRFDVLGHLAVDLDLGLDPFETLAAILTSFVDSDDPLGSLLVSRCRWKLAARRVLAHQFRFLELRHQELGPRPAPETSAQGH